jgi:hypothetical protein
VFVTVKDEFAAFQRQELGIFEFWGIVKASGKTAVRGSIEVEESLTIILPGRRQDERQAQRRRVHAQVARRARKAIGAHERRLVDWWRLPPSLGRLYVDPWVFERALRRARYKDRLACV